MRVKIVEMRPVGVWQWADISQDDSICGICRAPFEATCPTCANPGLNCPPVTGECTHSFHEHCILKWLEVQKPKQKCPMCRQNFICESIGLKSATEMGYEPNEESLDAEDDDGMDTSSL